MSCHSWEVDLSLNAALRFKKAVLCRRGFSLSYARAGSARKRLNTGKPWPEAPKMARQSHRVHPAQSWESFFFQTYSILLNLVRGLVDSEGEGLTSLGGEPLSLREDFGLGGVGGRARPDARRTLPWTLACSPGDASSCV